MSVENIRKILFYYYHNLFDMSPWRTIEPFTKLRLVIFPFFLSSFNPQLSGRGNTSSAEYLSEARRCYVNGTTPDHNSHDNSFIPLFCRIDLLFKSIYRLAVAL